MRNTLIATAIATAATLAMAGSASACPHGYKPVKIQGNWVCQLDVVPHGLNLKAKPKPTLPRRSDLGQQLQFQLNEANN